MYLPGTQTHAVGFPVSLLSATMGGYLLGNASAGAELVLTRTTVGGGRAVGRRSSRLREDQEACLRAAHPHIGVGTQRACGCTVMRSSPAAM